VQDQLLQVEAADARRADDGLPAQRVGAARERLDPRHLRIVAVDPGRPQPGAQQRHVGADERAADVEEDDLEIAR
jgi:hypothetical protein